MGNSEFLWIAGFKNSYLFLFHFGGASYQRFND